jgi:uncharacterized protein YdaU (DUF1376 family)
VSKAWMPLYIGDYMGDTSHLNQGQHGAYFLFIMHYWQRGSLPSDKQECYCIARAMDKQSMSNADKVLKEFFTLNGESYQHGRLDLELEKASKSYERRASAAKLRWKVPEKPRALQMQSMSNPCDYDSGSDLELRVREIAKLYPRIADVMNMPVVYANAIAEALMRHGDQVLAGTKRFRASYDRWPKDKLRFATSPDKYFNTSEYLLEPTDHSGFVPPQSAPAGYESQSVIRKRELEQRKAQGL